MSPDTATVMPAILGIGIAFAMALVPGRRGLRRDMTGPRERMTRPGGPFEGFTGHGAGAPGESVA